ncbi:hypothetical protein J6590_036976 [Homalodisca vitripennis]|nr:hypothetical protein J6590_036976 [Homalodisca vitripennis]
MGKSKGRCTTAALNCHIIREYSRLTDHTENLGGYIIYLGCADGNRRGRAGQVEARREVCGPADREAEVGTGQTSAQSVSRMRQWKCSTVRPALLPLILPVSLLVQCYRLPLTLGYRTQDIVCSIEPNSRYGVKKMLPISSYT